MKLVYEVNSSLPAPPPTPLVYSSFVLTCRFIHSFNASTYISGINLSRSKLCLVGCRGASESDFNA